MSLNIRAATNQDSALVFSFMCELAEYQKLSHLVDATEAAIVAALFGPQPQVYCDIAEWDGEPVGFTLWFLNFSSFRGGTASTLRTCSCDRRIGAMASAKR